MQVLPQNSEHRLVVRVTCTCTSPCTFTAKFTYGQQTSPERTGVLNLGTTQMQLKPSSMVPLKDCRISFEVTNSITGDIIRRTYGVHDGWGCRLKLHLLSEIEGRDLEVDMLSSPDRAIVTHLDHGSGLYVFRGSPSNFVQPTNPQFQVQRDSDTEMTLTMPIGTRVTLPSLPGQTKRIQNENETRLKIRHMDKVSVNDTEYQFFIFGEHCPLTEDVMSAHLGQSLYY